MNIKKEEWTAFAEFIAEQSTWNISQYIEDGTYTCCPFSTIERAYTAFSVWRTCHSQSEVKKFYDVDYVKANPDYDPREEYFREQEEEERKDEEIEYAYKEAAGLTYFGVEDWESDWDSENRQKQITRIAHELADRHEHLLISDGSYQMVQKFFDMYELSRDEQWFFKREYDAQHYFRYGYVQSI